MNGEVERFRYPENRRIRTLSMSSTASESSESDSGELSPREDKGKNRTWRQFSIPDTTAPVPPVKAVSGAATIRKRLYASVPGKHFIAIKDYKPSTAGELALEKGDEVEGNVALFFNFFYGVFCFLNDVLPVVSVSRTEASMYSRVCFLS